MDSALPLKGYCDLVNSGKKMYTPGVDMLFKQSFLQTEGCDSEGQAVEWVVYQLEG